MTGTVRTLQEVITAMKQVRAVDDTRQPFTGEIRLKYYDGYVQKSVQVKEIATA